MALWRQGMNWLLIVLVLWAGEPIVIEIPMNSEELCKEAMRKVADDFQRSPATPSPGFPKGATVLIVPPPEVTASCIQVSS